MSIKRKILATILKPISILVLKKYKPKVIGITGNVGKTTTKDFLVSILSESDKYNVFGTRGNLNSEIGIPLTIFLEKSGSPKLSDWFLILLKSIKLILFRYKEYPDILVLEIAADKKGDIENFVKYIKPNISTVTKLLKSPTHLNNYKNLDELYKEKLKMFEYTKDIIIVNNSNEILKENIAKLSNTKISVTYGLNDSDVNLLEYNLIYENNLPMGIQAKIQIKDNIFPIKIESNIGEHIAESALSAITFAYVLDVSIIDIINGIKKATLTDGRMQIINTKRIYIINDSYNSSPESAKKALQTFNEINSERRKVLILGGMNDLGINEEKEHSHLIKSVNGVVPVCILIGEKMNNALKNSVKRQNTNFIYFETVDDFIKNINEIIKTGDLILLKGSRFYRLDKVISAIS